MAQQDITMGSLPTVDADMSAFSGSGTPVAEEQLESEDRGDELPSETPPAEPEGEPEAPPAEPEQEPETPKGEGEPEQEPENDPEQQPEPEDKPEQKTKVENRVPYERFKKEIEKRKKLEAELRQIREAAPPDATPDIDFDVSVDSEQFKKMANAFVDGDTETAQATFTEFVKNAAQAAAKAAATKAYEAARAETEGAFTARSLVQEAQQAADLIQAEYDIFNDQSEAFDEEIFQEALRIRDGLMATGASAGEAILEAGQLVAARHGCIGNSVKAQQAASETSKPAAKAPNIQKKIEQAAKAPQKLGGEPNASAPTLDIMNMSDEEFEKLDAQELARLRGDYV